MGKILIDYGARGKREIHVPDSVDEMNIPPRIRELGEWLGEAIQGVICRQEHVDALRRAEWKLTEDTKPHFDAIAKDVERFKGGATNAELVDFYDLKRTQDLQE